MRKIEDHRCGDFLDSEDNLREQDRMIEGSLVSVIMIFLNEKEFIDEAIQSVLAQTYENWELLLVDDGSFDDSTNIARRYAQQYPEKVRYFEHPHHANRGMSASRNLGIQNAIGAYITFVDADDVVLPRKFEEQTAILQSQPEVALVCGRAEWWYRWAENAETAGENFVQKLDVPLDSVLKTPTLLILFLKDEWASLCDVMVRREAVEAVGGYEESFHGMYEDQAFHAKLCLNFPAYVSGETWYRYRQHPGSCCSVAGRNGNYAVARKRFLAWLEGYLKTQADISPALHKILQKERWGLRHPILRGVSRRIKDKASLLKNVDVLNDSLTSLKSYFKER